MSKLSSLVPRPYFWLTLVILAGLVIRLWFNHQHRFQFFYDQARDALYATQIATGDLMLMGPTASGTGDTVFHGVLWYYFLAPWYGLSPDPQLAVNALAILASANLGLIFLLSKKISRSTSQALLVTTLMSFSSLAIINSTWLSNPALIYFFLPPFIYACFRLWQKPTLPQAALAGLTLGLLTQAAIFQVYWSLLLLIVFLRAYNRKQLNWRMVTLSLGTFLLTTASMILTQALMISRGILTLDRLAHFNAAPSQGQLLDALHGLIGVYGTILTRSLFPQLLALSFSLALLIFYLYLRSPARSKGFYLLALSTPLLFLMFIFRDNVHLLAAQEFIFYLVIVKVIFLIKTDRLNLDKLRVPLSNLLLGTGLLLFLSLNWLHLYQIKKTGLHHISVQKGANLQDQLALIDETYRAARYEPFSFSANTNPFGIATTWFYLYHWYGQAKYGYTPTFLGPSQAGYPHQNLLAEESEMTERFPHHFTILEPETGLASTLEEVFLRDQLTLGGTPSAELKFGTINLLEFEPSQPPPPTSSPTGHQSK